MLLLSVRSKGRVYRSLPGALLSTAPTRLEEEEGEDVGNVEDGYVHLLRRCKDPLQGKEIHAKARKDGLDSGSFVGSAIVRMYGKLGCIEEAKKAFENVASRNVFLWNTMVTAFAQNGYLLQARKAFDEMPTRSVVSWNSIIVAYAKSEGASDEAFITWLRMNLEGEKPSRATFLAVVEACSTVEQVELVRIVASETGFVEMDVAVGTALVDVYGKLGKVEQAKGVFNSIKHKNVVSWTAMLGALTASAELLQDAKQHFDDIPAKNIVSWNVLLAAYVRHGKSREAVNLFKVMDVGGFQADSITFASVLDACANAGALCEGKVVYEAVRSSSKPLWSWDFAVVTGLISMFVMCGRMVEAKEVFDDMGDELRSSSSVPWTTMIGGYAKQGMLTESCLVLSQMSLEGLEPTEVLFISLLAACTHTGFVTESRRVFSVMIGDYHLQPAMEHYMCIADLMGKMGRLDEAREIVEDMPFEADIRAWKALLSSCGSHGDTGRGLVAAGLAMSIDKKQHSPYVLLSNVLKLAA